MRKQVGVSSSDRHSGFSIENELSARDRTGLVSRDLFRPDDAAESS